MAIFLDTGKIEEIKKYHDSKETVQMFLDDGAKFESNN